jgi:hypothetical protein
MLRSLIEVALPEAELIGEGLKNCGITVVDIFPEVTDAILTEEGGPVEEQNRNGLLEIDRPGVPAFNHFHDLALSPSGLVREQKLGQLKGILNPDAA